jgi:peptidoglycan hydrolase CwlO-like protein
MSNFSLLASLGLNTEAFQRGISTARGQSDSFKQTLGSLRGALMTLGLGAMARQAIDAGSKISDLSVQLNINSTALQVLQRATQDAGASQGSLERTLRNVQQRTQEAINGNTSYAEAFGRLGISVEEFKNLSPEKMFEVVARAQRDATDQGAAYNDVARILGQRAGPEMQEVLQRVAREGFDNLSESMIESGRVMNERAVVAADALSDAMGQMKDRMTVMIANVLPGLSGALGIVSQGWGVIWDLLRGNLRTINNLGTAIGALIAAALTPLVTKFQILGDAAMAAFHAIRGDFSEARASLRDVGDGVRQLSDDYATMAEDIVAAGSEFIQNTKDNFGEFFDDVADRNTEFEKSWDTLMSQFSKRAETGANEAGSKLNMLNNVDLSGLDSEAAGAQGEVAGIGTSAEAALRKIMQINTADLSAARSEMASVESEIARVTGEINSTRQAILNLNQSDLDDLLSEFGVTASQVQGLLQSRIASGLFDGGVQGSNAVETAMTDAISTLRQRARQVGDELGRGPSNADINRIIQLFRSVQAQSAFLANVPETVGSLANELRGLNGELSTLQNRRDALDSEIASLNASMDSVSSAISGKAAEIRAIQIPGSVFGGTNGTPAAGAGFTGIDSALATANTHLASIDRKLDGIFVNQ